MIAPLSLLFLASIAYASPIIEVRHNVTPKFTPKALAASTPAACVSTTMVTVTRFVDSTSVAPAETVIASVSSSTEAAASSSAEAALTSAPVADPAAANPTTPVPVSGAGGVLNPSDVAISQKFDDTAVRAIKGASIKDSTGKCLFIDPTAGDFRENLIPIAVQDCTGAAGEKFDFVTSGLHNNAVNSTLIVSSLMNGCLNFDGRRAAGNQVLMFSCGGRADGGGDTTNSQLFPFVAGETSTILAPENGNGQTCLVNNAGKLDQAACSGAASQVFTIG